MYPHRCIFACSVQMTALSPRSAVPGDSPAAVAALAIVVDRLLNEPPPPTEPYTTNDDIPPSPYIPLAHK